MSPPAYIWHVALDVGRGTRKTRETVALMLPEIGPHLERAISYPRGDPIPGRPGYATAARIIGGVLLATVGRLPSADGIVTAAVVTKSLQAAKAWQALHKGHPEFAASLGDVPRAPYCALRPEASLIYDLGASDWLDGYTAALAWAWIERPRDH